MSTNIVTKFRSMVSTLDSGWTSFVTNMGIPGKDKGESIFYARKNRGLLFETCEAIYRGDGIGARLVDVVVDDATSCGWRITFSSADGDEKADAELVNEANAKLEKWHKKTRFKSHLKRHCKQARWAGGSLLVLGIDDGQDKFEPLDINRIRSLDWVKALDRSFVSPSGHMESDPASPFFGFPSQYFLTSAFLSVDPTKVNTDTMSSTTVHATRVWRKDGVLISDRLRMQNNGWGDSVYDRSFESLKIYGSGLKASGTILQDITQGIYKLKGLPDVIAANAEGVLQQRFALMDQMKSIVNAIILDADGEDFERKTTSVTGIPDIILKHMINLAATVGMPMTKLFGVPAGGFGTGEAEGDNWDDVVKDYQEDEIRPTLEYVYGLLFQTPEFASIPDDWNLEFLPLQLESPKEEAELKKLTADTDAIYLDRQVLDRKEVAQSRFGGAKYSTETTLDDEIRASEDELDDVTDDDIDDADPDNQVASSDDAGLGPQEAAAKEGKVQQTALNGAQISSLTGMVAAVAEGTLPLESAVLTTLFGFPTMTEEEARAIFAPAEKLAAENEANKAKMRESLPTLPGVPPLTPKDPEPNGEKPDKDKPPTGAQ